jgi:hypothetical protein
MAREAGVPLYKLLGGKAGAADLQQLRPRHHGAGDAAREAKDLWPSTAASPTSSCAWAASGATRSQPTGPYARGRTDV